MADQRPRSIEDVLSDDERARIDEAHAPEADDLPEGEEPEADA